MLILNLCPEFRSLAHRVILGFLLLSVSKCHAWQQEPTKVTVGAYINDIQAIDLREHSYAVDIYIWFRWRDADLKPYESMEVVNPFELWGHVREDVYDEPITLPDGELYQVVRIQGKFSHKFFFYSYPFDRQNLTIKFEDAAHETNRLEYVQDAEPFVVNPEMKLPGYQIAAPKIEVRTVKYPTAFGDTRRTEPNSYSRVSLSVPIQRPVITSCVKMLLPVICVVIGASLMLRMRVSYVDSRIGVGITALLTVVAIQLSSNDNMPNVDYLVFMDKIDLCAYAYVLIGLGIVLATIRRLDQGHAQDAERLQRFGFAAITISFILAVSAFLAQAIIAG